MTFAPFPRAARLAIAAATGAALGLAAPSSSWADGNLPSIFVGQEETILIPVPVCPKCVAAFLRRSPDGDRFALDCICPD